MNFYRDQVTSKSWVLLQNLARKYRFVLIGGWAVWLYTHQLKSKDIDLIVEFDQLAKLKKDFDLAKNDRLKKYEIVLDEIHIDVYVPHYSQLGAEVNQTTIVDGFTVPPPETLIALKLVAYRSRANSPKGRKDLIDIVSLLSLPHLNWTKIPPQTLDFLKSQTSIPELNLNSHQFSRLKKKWIDKLQLKCQDARDSRWLAKKYHLPI